MFRFRTTRITKARFVYSPFSAEAMAGIAEIVKDQVIKRIKRAENCEDQFAKPLKPGKNGKSGYPERKTKAGIAPYRNWIGPASWTKGRIKTLRAIKVKRANENRAVIGFIDSRADHIAHINNRHDKQFGMSPNDKKVFLKAANDVLRAARLVRAKKVA